MHFFHFIDTFDFSIYSFINLMQSCTNIIKFSEIMHYAVRILSIVHQVTFVAADHMNSICCSFIQRCTYLIL